ncbi:MAG: hypothetical protein HGB15_08170 [Chlorobaculum sp.]|nr:hypothetical protein [Chlorobaculum sp.]
MKRGKARNESAPVSSHTPAMVKRAVAGAMRPSVPSVTLPACSVANDASLFVS